MEGIGDYHQWPEIPLGAEDVPPAWKPNPNIPVFTENRILNDLRNDVDKLKKNPLMQKPSEVPDDNKLKRPSEVK
jgi:hypothetical protein